MNDSLSASADSVRADEKNQSNDCRWAPDHAQEELKKLDRIFGPAPVLEGEDTGAYNELLMRITVRLKPSDIIEDIWVREITVHSWEILRWHRAKNNFLSYQEPISLENPLAPVDTADRKYAQILVFNLSNIERIDQLILAAETRRDLILREIDRRRATIAQARRDTIRKIEDAEFKIVEPEHRTQRLVGTHDKHSQSKS